MMHWKILAVLLCALVASTPGCRKKTAEQAADVASEGDVKSEKGEQDVQAPKSKKKGKKASKRAKKGNKKETAPPQAPATPPTPPSPQPLPQAPASPLPQAPTPPSSPAPLPAPPLPPPPVQIPITRLLSVADLNEYLEVKGWISYGAVPGMVPSEGFNSVIYRKPGESAFVSLLAWDFEQYAQALERWNELYATWPNAKEQDKLFTKLTFFSYRNQVSSLVFLEPDRSMVLAVSCHTQVCDDTKLLNIARSVFSKAR